MQADMELQLNGTYDCLDAVIFSVPCDTLRCMSQKWHGKARSSSSHSPRTVRSARLSTSSKLNTNMSALNWNVSST